MNKREVSLDVFRGLAVASMILVNSPGSWAHIYAPLQHSAWHGMTPTDLVFPFFLFAVGNSLYFALQNSHANLQTIIKALTRTCLLFAIGVFLNAFPFTNNVEGLRLMGVLQRIALCYFISVIIILSCKGRGLILATVAMLLAYWLAMGTDANAWELNNNLVVNIDIALIGGQHMYQGFGTPFEPEGLLSTIGAIPTVLIGYITATHLSNTTSFHSKVRLLLRFGILLTLTGLLWSLYLPLNKPLWSGSYTLVSTGIAQLTLALIVDLQSRKVLLNIRHSLEIYGSNPLFIYSLSWLYAVTMAVIIRFEIDGTPISLNEWLFQILTKITQPKLASLLYAVITVILFFLISKWLYQQRIFIKV